MSVRSINGAFVIVLVVLASAGRLIYLDADPSFPTWIGYVVDEGRWSETARNLALFGDPDVNWFSRLHLFISPGYQAVNYIVFLALGVDFWSARLFGAVAGILVLLTVFVALRRHVTSLALAFGVVVLGLETNVFWASRMALPEMPAVLATLLAFFLLVLGRKTPWSAGVAGLLAVIAVAMKGTTVLAVLIFPVIALIGPSAMPIQGRIVRATAFVAGFALPIVAACAALSVLGYLKADAVGDIAGRFLDFLSLTSAYVAASRFFDSTELEARNLLLLGMWFCSWRWFARQPRTRCIVDELYLASGIWAGWWLLVWSANTYLPGRYQVHFVVPATIHIMAGLSLGGRDFVARIVANLEQCTRLGRVTALGWLVFPSAIVLSSVAAGLAGVAGWNADRLLERTAIVAVLTALLTSLEYSRQVDERSIVRFLSFPVLMVLLWLGGRELGLISSFWMFDSGASVALWSAASVAAFMLCLISGPAKALASSGRRLCCDRVASRDPHRAGSAADRVPDVFLARCVARLAATSAGGSADTNCAGCIAVSRKRNQIPRATPPRPTNRRARDLRAQRRCPQVSRLRKSNPSGSGARVSIDNQPEISSGRR